MSKARRKQRQASRKGRKANKDAKRNARKTNRFNARDQRQQARISTRNAKKLSKIYGDLDPDDVNNINQIQPYVGFMNDQLQEQGIDVQDPNDPIEVGMKYVQTNPDMGDPMSDELYDDAFVNGEEMYESHFDFAGAKQIGLKAAKGALGGAIDELDKTANQVSKKKPDDRTPAEQKLLDLSNKKKNFENKEAMDYVKDILPILAIVVVIWFVIKSV